MADSRPMACWPGSEWTRMASSSSRVAPCRTGRGGGTCCSISMVAAASLVQRSRWSRQELPNRVAIPGRGRKPLGRKMPGGKTPGGKKVKLARGTGFCSASGLEIQFGPKGYCETLFVNKVENDRVYFQHSEMSSIVCHI